MLSKTAISRTVKKPVVLRFEFLASLIREHGLKRGAELGLWKGKTFFYLLSHCPDLFLVGVDQWAYRPERAKIPGGQTYREWNMKGLEKTVREGAKKYGERARILKMDTAEAAQSFEDQSFDFVFIDGDHSTQGVTRDIQAWLPKIREGGYITGHDISWPSVKKAVDELLPGYRVSGTHSDAVWYLRLKPAAEPIEMGL